MKRIRTIQSFPVHILPNGDVTSIPNWTGGEVEAKIVVHFPPTEKALQERAKAFEKFEELRESLKNTPGAELMTKKQIRAARLEEKYGEQTEEERKAAGRKFFDSWNGALKGARDMTAKEIRAERLERKYGQ